MFERDAIDSLKDILGSACPWIETSSELLNRTLYEWAASDGQGRQQTKREADLICYLTESSQSPCVSLPDSGLLVVRLPVSAAESWPPEPAAPVTQHKAGEKFSPPGQVVAPQKYFLAESYGGMRGVEAWKEKLTQLDTLLSFARNRWVDRTGYRGAELDITAIVGAAGLILSRGKTERAKALQAAASMVLRRATRSENKLLYRLLRAGRFFVMVLDDAQMALTQSNRAQIEEQRALGRKVEGLVIMTEYNSKMLKALAQKMGVVEEGDDEHA